MTPQEKAFIKKQIESGATLVIEDPEEFYGRTSMANVIICNPALTAEEVRVYSIIKSFCYSSKTLCWPGQDRIAALAGTTRKTVNKTLASLRRKKLIDWLRRGRGMTNVYIIKKIPSGIIETYMNALAYLENDEPAKPDKSTDVTFRVHLDVPERLHLDVTETTHEEIKDQEYNVVVIDRLADTASKEATRNGGQGGERNKEPGQAKSPGGTEQKNGAVPVLSGELIEKLRSVNEQLLNSPLLEVISQYSEEEIITALAVVLQQKHVSNPPGFFWTALEKGWKPARPYTPPPRTGPRNAGTRAGPSGTGEEEVRKQKKRELIRSLYMS